MARTGGNLWGRLHRPVRERAVFLHVPKCGGTSIRVALRDAYSWPFSGSRRDFFHLSPHRSEDAAKIVGQPVTVLRDALLRYHLSKERIRLATGHFRWPHGLREAFPDVALITVLRDPVSHFLSSYYFRRDERGPRQRKRIAMDLDAFLESKSARDLGAMFVRFLLGPIDPEDPADAGVIAEAASHLASVDVIGVLEDLPGFGIAFQRRFGAPLRIPRANAGRLRSEGEGREITEDHVARIRELVRPNQVLYEVALSEIRRRTEA